MISMRTTLTLDNDVFQIVKEYAESRSVALGKAVSELVRRGHAAPRPTRTVNGVQVFDLPADSPVATMRKIQELEDAER
jgi:hypothetical protein